MEVGDKIQCWSKHECIRKMMLLAKDGIMTKEEPEGSNKLVVVEVRDMDEPKD